MFLRCCLWCFVCCCFDFIIGNTRIQWLYSDLTRSKNRKQLGIQQVVYHAVYHAFNSPQPPNKKHQKTLNKKKKKQAKPQTGSSIWLAFTSCMRAKVRFAMLAAFDPGGVTEESRSCDPKRIRCDRSAGWVSKWRTSGSPLTYKVQVLWKDLKTNDSSFLADSKTNCIAYRHEMVGLKRIKHSVACMVEEDL